MPLTNPTLDDRKYQEILDEALARIPIHNPEWTNFNKSDPGVTLLELFAFLTESLLYRCNQIPERNRKKFLSLLGVPMRPAASALGIITFTNDRGPLKTLTLNGGLEVRAGQTPFRTESGLDVLPIEGRVYYKRVVTNGSDTLKEYYKQLYSSLRGQPPTKDVKLYETVPFVPSGTTGLDLGTDTVDNTLWIALLLRESDSTSDETKDSVRKAIGGKTLNLGIMPSLRDVTRRLKPGGELTSGGKQILEYRIPKISADLKLPDDPNLRVPEYKSLDARSNIDVLSEPGIVQITLPPEEELQLWENLDPLEPGSGDFPPNLDDSKLEDRVITWIRINSKAATDARILWVGINAACVTQRSRVSNEVLPSGTGAPDQSIVLSKTPVVPNSVKLSMTLNNASETWTEIDDLSSAGPEVPVQDRRLPPGAKLEHDGPVRVYALDPESGTIRFGDGVHGARPQRGSIIRADYDFAVGREGNVGAGSINTSPSLPAGLKVTNPLPSWGGSEAESVTEAEKHITRYLQHRDRLVTVEDFKTISKRTPGVDIGRIEVLPAFNPQLGQNEKGDAPGAVTLMVIPKYDLVQPDAPMPDRLFLDAVCDYLEPRRLVTTEVFIRGPKYKSIWVSVGLNVVAGASVAQVREDVKKALLQYLSPLPADQGDSTTSRSGWPLNKSVVAAELLAEATRVSGVLSVKTVLLAEGTNVAVQEVKMSGLELPRVAGISIAPGDPTDLDDLRGQATSQTGQSGQAVTEFVSVPVLPEECM
ncbi:MAG: hypothetical protein HW389_896 [Bacteroidetes bacterium]|nr:hypothetical protein [Bacteroidota bacterium]